MTNEFVCLAVPNAHGTSPCSMQLPVFDCEKTVENVFCCCADDVVVFCYVGLGCVANTQALANPSQRWHIIFPTLAFPLVPGRLPVGSLEGG